MRSEHFQLARSKEIHYHEQFYEESRLFQPGSWLAKPVKAVMESLQLLPLQAPLQILDLGCGVGRNTIPIAQQVGETGGRVTGVDLLPVAIQKLKSNAEEYGVTPIIQGITADVEFFPIDEEAYHFILVCSCLEHVSSIAAFREVIGRMIRGTKTGGINCIQMSTEVEELIIATSERTEGLIELRLRKDQALSHLHSLYSEWEIITVSAIPQQIPEMKDGQEILFKSNWLTFIARRN